MAVGHGTTDPDFGDRAAPPMGYRPGAFTPARHGFDEAPAVLSSPSLPQGAAGLSPCLELIAPFRAMSPGRNNLCGLAPRAVG
ncbi:MAG: hypothetical protein GDA36_05845 [Rhodobacteraceae bacterium]|nr:hypothetical protein [Paracoccaceae bacterium]